MEPKKDVFSSLIRNTKIRTIVIPKKKEGEKNEK